MNERIERLLDKVAKPARYTGGEFGAIYKDLKDIDYRVCFCFPDTYEIGMSHLGLRILYGLMNEIPGVWCERSFAPWVDMEALLREEKVPIFSLESGDPLNKFDMLAFTLQYELSYTNVLNMIDLSGIPLQSSSRNENHPLIIAGGPGAFNPEPMADFIDLFIVGEGEEVTLELLELCKTAAVNRLSRAEMLRAAADIPGVYVPSFYKTEYYEDGRIKSFTPTDGVPGTIKKRIITNLDSAYFPVNTIVPTTEVVHDRVSLELFRGCIRGCRFCQAGHTNRPVRSKDKDTLIKQGIEGILASGYEEISLTSLSTSDYKQLEPLCDGLLEWCKERNVNLSVPSLRADSFSSGLMHKLQEVRKSGLTFAPEAGSQRLRDVINKNITEEEILEACAIAFEGGWNSVKLYFMMGLPTETDEDIEGIADLSRKVQNAWKKHAVNKQRGVKVSVSCSCFVPKPHTPFQWEGQNTPEEFLRKQDILKRTVGKGISLSWHDAGTSYLEGILSRGDRRLGKAIETAFRMGCRLDGWSEHFSLELWMKAMEECGLSPDFYATRVRGEDELLPWDHIDAGVTKEFLLRERARAYAGETTPNCREACSGCGAAELAGGGACCE